MEKDDLYIYGRNAVIEALKSNGKVMGIIVQKGLNDGPIKNICQMAEQKNIEIKEVSKLKLDEMAKGNHQGVIARMPPYEYWDMDQILSLARKKNKKPFVIILDEIQDPQNLGSILRTADACGADGIIIPKRRNVGVTSGVIKASAGAIQYVPVAKVTNINNSIKILKDNGLWIVGAEIDAEKYYDEADLNIPLGIIIGSEGYGISRLVKENCDILVKIPMVGKINSLNAGVAGAILMYEVLRQRKLRD